MNNNNYFLSFVHFGCFHFYLALFFGLFLLLLLIKMEISVFFGKETYNTVLVISHWLLPA